MKIPTCVTEVRIVTSAQSRPSAVRVVIVAGDDGAADVHDFADRAHMIAGVVVCYATVLNALDVVALENSPSAGIPLFAQFGAAPEVTLVACSGRAVLLDDAHPATQAVIGELRSQRPIDH